MQPTNKFRNDGFEAIHSAASALFKVGAIDRATMREFDAIGLNSPASASFVGWASEAPPTDASCNHH